MEIKFLIRHDSKLVTLNDMCVFSIWLSYVICKVYERWVLMYNTVSQLRGLI